MEWEGAAGGMAYAQYPGEQPSNGAGVLGGNGVKGPVNIPKSYYNQAGEEGLCPRPWFDLRNRASADWYAARGLGDLILKLEADDAYVMYLPGTWRHTRIYEGGGEVVAGDTVTHSNFPSFASMVRMIPSGSRF